MARIRTIKPEFPHSETIGRLGRESRLLFILLWTIVDDEGRARASSRMLASLLYPYDDDAGTLIEGWLTQLEKENCIRRYIVDGSAYLDIPNWLKHQKIDRPSGSRLPPFQNTLAKPREASRSLAADLGPSILDLGPGPTAVVGARDLLSHWPSWLRVAETIGADLDDPNWAGQHGRVAQWLADWDLELDILPTLGRIHASHKTSGRPPIKNLKYFEGAIADAYATRCAPIPMGNPTQGKSNGKDRSVSAAAFRLAEQGFSFGPRPNGVSSQEGGDTVRLLPKR